MYIYDELNALVRAFEKSPEKQRLVEAQNKLKEDSDALALAKEFFGNQMILKTKEMMGTKLSDEEIVEHNRIANQVMANGVVAEYIQAQMAIGQALNDVFTQVNEASGMDMGLIGGFPIQ